MNEIMTREQYEKWAEEERARQIEEYLKFQQIGGHISHVYIGTYEDYLKEKQEEAQLKREMDVYKKIRLQALSVFSKAQKDEWSNSKITGVETSISKKIDKALMIAEKKAEKEIKKFKNKPIDSAISQ